MTTSQLADVGILSESTPTQPLGALFVFATEEDPHSPLMLPRYRELAETYLEGQVPMHEVKVASGLPELEKWLIQSVPTLLWVKDGTILLRLVGTTLPKKLEAEADRVIEKLLG